ncbi:hypothetical protein GQ457_11G028200 [Hibiscus cannabinus]
MVEQRFDDVWGLILGLHIEDAWLHGKKKEWEMMSWDLDMCEKRCYGILACVRNDAMGSWHVWKMMSWDLDISLARGKQGSKGDQVKPLFKYGFCDYGSVNKQWGGPDFCNSGVEYRYPIRGIGTKGGVSVPKPPLGLEYRYWLPSTDTSCLKTVFGPPLKPDFLHLGPHVCHV